MPGEKHFVEAEELMAYLDGEVSEERSGEIALHLGTCADCKASVVEFGGISKRLSTWEVGESEEAMGPVVIAEIEKRAESRRVGKKHWNWKWNGRGVWAGATAMAAVLVGMVLFRGSGGVMPVARMTAERQEPESQTMLVQQEFQAAQGRRQMANQIASQLDKVDLERDVAGAEVRARAPMIARTSELVVITKDFDRVRAEIDAAVKTHQGYVGQLSVTGSGNNRVFEATLRIPSDKLDAVMADLKKLGRVESEQQNAEEVTREYVDLDARLVNARNAEKRLTDLLQNRAGRLTDVLDVEKEIQRVREQIETMTAEEKALVNRVSFATLNVSVREESKAQLVPDSMLNRLINAARSGYRNMLENVMAMVMLVLTAGPSLLLWIALLFLPLRWIWKRRQSLRQIFPN